MRHLNGVDHMFLSLETATTTGVMGGLIRFDAPSGPDEHAGRRPDAAFMRSRIQDRLADLPPLRWRLVRVPLGLDHAYLADSRRVDLDVHVRTVQLPSPGTDEQLADEVGRLMSHPLAAGRPLWELVVIDGLADGSIVHLFRMHHVVIDGGSMPVLFDLLSDTPLIEPDPSWRPSAQTEPRAGGTEMLVRGLVSGATRPVRMAGLGLKLAAWGVRNTRRDAGASLPAVLTRLTPGNLATPAAAVLNRLPGRDPAAKVKPLLPKLFGPATVFNQRMTAGRRVAFSDLSLAELKAAGKPFGATLNDVVLAICAGALRRYLQENGGLPEKPLMLCVPVGLRDPQAPFRWANDISMVFTEFPTHLADPLARLEFAGRGVKEARANLDRMPMQYYEQAAAFMPEQFFSIPAKLMAVLPAWVPGPATWNVVVSNVRGPAKDLHFAGNRITGIWPVSFLSPVGGVNITLQSYTDRVDFAVVACADHVGELDSLVGYLFEELETLKEIAASTTAAP